MNYFFVLGARDPEMIEIAGVLEAQGIGYTPAKFGRLPVRSSDAYRATSVHGLIPRHARRIFVECDVFGLTPDEVCDHHSPGDSGYGLPPEQYLQGSSLGQVLDLLRLKPSAEQRITAAADHCLRHAYEGRCPGVDPSDLAAWRERSRADARGITVKEIQHRIEFATDALQSAPRIHVAGEEIAWFPLSSPLPSEVAEASARLGTAFCYVKRDGDRRKGGIMSATPHVIRAWMRECGLKHVYGDPARGFAGGYYL